MPTLAREFDISLSTVHAYIDEQRKLVRAQTIDLAAQERDQALELLDNAIERVGSAHQWPSNHRDDHRAWRQTTHHDDRGGVAGAHEGMSSLGAAP